MPSISALQLETDLSLHCFMALCNCFSSLTKVAVFVGQQEAVEAAGPSGKEISVTVLLSQALRSDDHQLLEKCFAISSAKVVKSTVQQLAPQDAARLLHVAVQRLQSSPKRGKQIAVWLRALLLFHTAYLISAPGMYAFVHPTHLSHTFLWIPVGTRPSHTSRL